MIGAIIGGGLAAAGSIAGGIMGARSAKRAQKELDKQREENQRWYDRRYNEDPTQRASAQRMITQVTEAVRNRNKGISGTQAVVGGTDAAVAAEKERNNKIISDTVSTIAASGDASKDAVEATYRARESELSGQQMAVDNAKTQAIAGAVTGVAQAGANLATAGSELSEANKALKQQKMKV